MRKIIPILILGLVAVAYTGAAVVLAVSGQAAGAAAVGTAGVVAAGITWPLFVDRRSR